MEADARLDGRLLGIVDGRHLVRIVRDLRGREAPEGLPGEVRLACEIATRDELPFGVGGQPVGTAAEQLLDLGGAHPVVLLVIEHRDEDVQVAQQVAQPDGG